MCKHDDTFEKLGVEKKIIHRIFDEAVVSGKEYVKICRKCGDINICVYANITSEDIEPCIKTLALSVLMSSEKELDSFMLALFKYSHIIISKKGFVEFYIPREYAIGVYYGTCKDTSMDWDVFELLEYEDIAHLIGDENDNIEN
ncbi:MAG: hypothetical protein QXP02_01365 [Desulfurococcaceae archaeon]